MTRQLQTQRAAVAIQLSGNAHRQSGIATVSMANG